MMEKSITRAYKEICYMLQQCGVEMRMVLPITNIHGLIASVGNVWFLKYCIKNNLAELIENNAYTVLIDMITSAPRPAYHRLYPSLFKNGSFTCTKSFLTIDKIIASMFCVKKGFCWLRLGHSRPHCEGYLCHSFGWVTSNEGWDFWQEEYKKMYQTLQQKDEKYGCKLTYFLLTDILNDFDVIAKYYDGKINNKEI